MDAQVKITALLTAKPGNRRREVWRDPADIV
jgi:hypothetical protein